ncbi:MAG: TRAP transporter TatT component family protein [Bacteroidota bacterium]|nr:TRAP transporter TatT component family protein [Bacteroidota bacterium]
MKIVPYYLLVFIFAATSWSCGVVNTVAVNATTNIVDFGFGSIFEESDLDFAEKSIPGNLTLIEALYRAKDRDDDHLALLLTEGYTGYTLGFVEDVDAERAKVLYARARDYGLKVLKKNKVFAEAFDQDIQSFTKSLNQFDKDDVPIIFWTANAWGNLINVSISDPEVVGDLPKVNALMEFVLRHDEGYYYGSAHLYFGTILATIPKNLGGKPDSAKQHFDKCLAIGQNKMLLPFVYMAKSYCVQVQDKELFLKSLRTVDETSIDILPEQRLVNAIAKRKAKMLAAKVDDLFF